MALHGQLDEIIQAALPVVQRFHSQAMLAPHAATIDKSGTLAGRLLATDGSPQLSVSQAIEHFEHSFAHLAKAGELQATGIFYHSPGIDVASPVFALPPAATADESRNLVAMLEHVSGQSVYLLIPYRGQPPSVEYGMGKLIEKPPKIFEHRQSQPALE